MEEANPLSVGGKGKELLVKKRGKYLKYGDEKIRRVTEGEIKRLKEELEELRKKVAQLEGELISKEEKIGKQGNQIGEAAEIMMEQQKVVNKMNDEKRNLEEKWMEFFVELGKHFGGCCDKRGKVREGIKRKLEELNELLSTKPGIEVKQKMEVNATPKSGGKVKRKHGENTSKSHSGFYCFCGKDFSTKANLQIHVVSLTTEGKFQCKECGKRFTFLSYLTRHRQSSHGVIGSGRGSASKLKYGCVQCGKCFKDKGALLQHQKLKHNSEPAREPELREQVSDHPVVEVKEEEEENDDDEDLMIVEEKPIPRFTSPPGERTPKMSSVALALASRSTISPVKTFNSIAKSGGSTETVPEVETNSSDEAFSQIKRNAEQRKKKTQKFLATLKHGVNPQNPRQCLCGYASYYKFHVKRHVDKIMAFQSATVNAGQTFECEVCGEPFKDKGKLRLHSNVHTRKITDFGCKVCKTRFPTRVGLMCHMRNKHDKPTSSSPVSTSKSTRIAVPKIKLRLGKKLIGIRNVSITTKSGKCHKWDESRSDNSDQDFYCVCGSHYCRKTLLESHIKYFGLKKRFRCNVCAYRCRTLGSLKKHQLCAHNQTSTEFSISCLDCGTVFSSRQEFIEHKKAEHGMYSSGGRRKGKLESDNDSKPATWDDPASPQPIPIAIPIFFEDE